MKPITAPTASPLQTAATEPATSARAAGAVRDPRLDKVRHAASEFESMLVKQLLKAAHIGATAGSEKANGYGDMAVDALASAIEHGGGLGLANRIQQALHLSAQAPAQAAGAVLATPSSTAALPGAAATVPLTEPDAHNVGIPASRARLKVP